MTNQEIINEAAQLAGYVTEDGTPCELFTYSEWARRGYKVKRGAHAAITVKLWKRTRVHEHEEQQTDTENQNAENLQARMGFYLCKSYLFTRAQVEREENHTR